MSKEELKRVLIEAMDWERNLTERQYNEITLAEAKEEKLNEILKELYPEVDE